MHYTNIRTERNKLLDKYKNVLLILEKFLLYFFSGEELYEFEEFAITIKTKSAIKKSKAIFIQKSQNFKTSIKRNLLLISNKNILLKNSFHIVNTFFSNWLFTNYLVYKQI